MSWRASLSKNLQELRVHFCQKSEASAGARAFVSKNYATLKQLNPAFPILIRESSNAVPMLYARYDFGLEKSVNLSKLSEADIVKHLESLVKEAASLPRSAESCKPVAADII